jgi:DNA-binding winged helix-turn-helix (wHTH) protein
VDEETFVFGSLRLVPAQRMLFEDGKPLRIGGRALDILVVLVENAGETIRKGSADRPDLVRYGRRRRCVAGSCRCAAQGAGRAGTRYIANIPGGGYRFIAPVPHEQRQRAIAQANGAAVRGNLPALVTRIVGLTEGLISVVREMRATVFRTARSVAIYEAKDFSCDLFDPEAQVIAQSEDIGAHVCHCPGRSNTRWRILPATSRRAMWWY